MHEWALAEAIISAVSKYAQEERLKEITEVKIKTGKLQQIEPEILRFALEQIKTSDFKNTRFDVEVVNAKLKCRICEEEWAPEMERLNKESSESIHFVPETVHAFVKCPKCGSRDLEILSGRGVWLEGIEGMK